MCVPSLKEVRVEVHYDTLHVTFIYLHHESCNLVIIVACCSYNIPSSTKRYLHNMLIVNTRRILFFISRSSRCTSLLYVQTLPPPPHASPP